MSAFQLDTFFSGVKQFFAWKNGQIDRRWPAICWRRLTRRNRTATWTIRFYWRKYAKKYAEELCFRFAPMFFFLGLIEGLIFFFFGGGVGRWVSAFRMPIGKGLGWFQVWVMRERLRVGWYRIYFNGCWYMCHLLTLLEFFCGWNDLTYSHLELVLQL